MGNLSILIVALATLALVFAASDVVEFRRNMNKSRQQCRIRKISNTVDSTCRGARTLADIVSTIPGERATIRPYAGADLMKTFDLCLTREDGSASDWRNLLAAKTRVEAGATGRTDVLTECKAQIALEKKDCANMKEMICAFSQGLDFTCMSDSQKRRTANTLTNDNCFQLNAVSDGRPDSLREFNLRLRDTRLNCRKEQDTVHNRCRSERSMEAIMREVPKGVNTLAKAGTARSDLRKTIENCLAREDFGFTEFRRQTLRTLPGAKNRDQRNKCLAQLKDEASDCVEAKKIVCAFTYGVDFSCAPAAQKRSEAAENDCYTVELAIQAGDL